jgi:hypothetical protein
MRAQIPDTSMPGSRRRLHPNRIFFPRELRDAIPDLPTCLGRELAVESVRGRLAGSTPWFGEGVQLNLLAKETGKLTGEFVVRMYFAPDAARALADTLIQLADLAEQKPSQA